MLAYQFYVLPMLWVICSVGGHVVKRSTSPAPHTNADGNEIHCYCNLPACITSSYMCKTEKIESGCFKRFDPIAGQYHYGCLDLVTKQTMCSKTTSPEQPNAHECCFADMCNHHESAEGSNNLIPSYHLGFNDSDDESDDTLLKNVRPTTITLYTNSEIWFRAVLIAVPICGFTILLILIFIAVRILRSDVPEDRISSSKLIKDKYEIAAVTGVKLPQSPSAETHNYNLGNSFKSTKYTLLERSFPFVFRQQSNQHGNGAGAKCTKYQGFIPKHKYAADNTTGVHHVPKTSEKFSRQNLNILKLPHKLNELKKSDKNTNVGLTNNNRDCSISFSNSVTNVHSYPNAINLRKYDFIR